MTEFQRPSLKEATVVSVWVGTGTLSVATAAGPVVAATVGSGVVSADGVEMTELESFVVVGFVVAAPRAGPATTRLALKARPAAFAKGRGSCIDNILWPPRRLLRHRGGPPSGADLDRHALREDLRQLGDGRVLHADAAVADVLAQQ